MTELNAKNLGLAFGVVIGIYVFFLGLMAAYLNWGTKLVEGIASLYIGYSPTFIGSIIGGIWGFIDGFIGGFLIAWLYNRFQK